MFVALYVAVAWIALQLAAGLIVQGFGLDADGAAVLHAFAQVGAAAYVFTGALFVSNAAFNNLGRPLWSTGFNWSRDALAIPVLAWAFAPSLGLAAAVYIQAIAGVMVGTLAAITGWKLVRRVANTHVEPAPAPIPAITSGRAVEAFATDPLASPDAKR